MSEESSRGFSTSIYVRDRASFEECKRLLELQGKSLSKEIASFVCQKLAELKGTESKVDSTRRLEDLKEEYDDLVVKTVKLERQLKTSKHFEEATDLLIGLGLKRDFSNADELIPKFVSAWKGDEGFMHEYLNLVELARDKEKALRALTVMRSQYIRTEVSQPQDCTKNRESQPAEGSETEQDKAKEERKDKEEGAEKLAEEDRTFGEDDPDEEEFSDNLDDEEEDGLQNILEEEKQLKEESEEESEEPTPEKPLAEPFLKCRAIVPIGANKEEDSS